MANVSKVMLGAAIAAVSIASQHWLPIRASQFLLIRTDMSHKAVKEAVLVLLPQCRARLTIRRSPVAVALAIIKTSASISGDVARLFVSRTLNSSALGRLLLADRAGGPGPSDRPRPTMVGATKSFATAIDIRDMTKW